MEIRELEHKFINDIKKIVYKNISNLPKNCFVVNESSEIEDTKLSFEFFSVTTLGQGMLTPSKIVSVT
jgi:hypothetical protein